MHSTACRSPVDGSATSAPTPPLPPHNATHHHKLTHTTLLYYTSAQLHYITTPLQQLQLTLDSSPTNTPTPATHHQTLPHTTIPHHYATTLVIPTIIYHYNTTPELILTSRWLGNQHAAGCTAPFLLGAAGTGGGRLGLRMGVAGGIKREPPWRYVSEFVGTGAASVPPTRRGAQSAAVRPPPPSHSTPPADMPHPDTAPPKPGHVTGRPVHWLTQPPAEARPRKRNATQRPPGGPAPGIAAGRAAIRQRPSNCHAWASATWLARRAAAASVAARGQRSCSEGPDPCPHPQSAAHRFLPAVGGGGLTHRA